MHKQKITSLALVIWFTCAFFYSLEYFIRSSTGAFLDNFMLAPYELNTTSIALFSSAFYWCYVASQIPAGILVDKFGVKRVMIFSTLIFSIAILIASKATSIHSLTIYRALAGFGGGFAFLCTLKTISIWLPNRAFPLFTGFTQLLLYVGATLSAAPLVILVGHYSIATIMQGVFIISLILLIFSIFVIKIHPDFNKQNKKDRPEVNVLKNLTEILKNKQIWLNGLYCFTIYGTTVLFADLWGIRYLQLSGFSEVSAGLCTSMIFIGVAIFSPLWGIIATVFNGERRFLIIAPIFGLFIVIALLYLNSNPYIAYALCILFGGTQAVHVLNYSALRNTVSPTQIATGLALVNLFLPLSGGVLQPITGAIIGHLKQTNDPLYAFQIAMLFVPALMILSFIIGLLIKDKVKD